MATKRRVNGFGEDAVLDVVLLGGGIAALYFFVIKPAIASLGLGNTDPAITAEFNLPGVSNPFNYQFQPFVDFYNNNTPQISGTSPSFSVFSLITPYSGSQSLVNPTIQQFFQFLKANPGYPSPWGFLDTADLSARAENLYNSLSISKLNPLSTSDQTGGMSALSGLSNQLQIAFIANYFWWNFNVDLLTFMQGSLTKSGFTPANLLAIINNINSLPVNPS